MTQTERLILENQIAIMNALTKLLSFDEFSNVQIRADSEKRCHVTRLSLNMDEKFQETRVEQIEYALKENVIMDTKKKSADDEDVVIHENLLGIHHLIVSKDNEEFVYAFIGKEKGDHHTIGFENSPDGLTKIIEHFVNESEQDGGH